MDTILARLDNATLKVPSARTDTIPLHMVDTTINPNDPPLLNIPVPLPPVRKESNSEDDEYLKHLEIERNNNLGQILYDNDGVNKSININKINWTRNKNSLYLLNIENSYKLVSTSSRETFKEGEGEGENAELTFFGKIYEEAGFLVDSELILEGLYDSSIMDIFPDFFTIDMYKNVFSDNKEEVKDDVIKYIKKDIVDILGYKNKYETLINKYKISKKDNEIEYDDHGILNAFRDEVKENERNPTKILSTHNNMVPFYDKKPPNPFKNLDLRTLPAESQHVDICQVEQLNSKPLSEKYIETKSPPIHLNPLGESSRNTDCRTETPENEPNSLDRQYKYGFTQTGPPSSNINPQPSNIESQYTTYPYSILSPYVVIGGSSYCAPISGMVKKISYKILWNKEFDFSVVISSDYWGFNDDSKIIEYGFDIYKTYNDVLETSILITKEINGFHLNRTYFERFKLSIEVLDKLISKKMNTESEIESKSVKFVKFIEKNFIISDDKNEAVKASELQKMINKNNIFLGDISYNKMSSILYNMKLKKKRMSDGIYYYGLKRKKGFVPL